MANVFKIKRSGATGSAAPATLAEGELAHSENSQKLFIGTNAGQDIQIIGGKVYTDKLDTIETNAKDDQIATEVPFTSAATNPVTATNVNAAIDELADEAVSASSSQSTKDAAQDGRLTNLETFQAGADDAYVNVSGDTMTGALVVGTTQISGSSITTTDTSNLQLGEAGETVSIPGNLAVGGTTTTVNSTDTAIADNQIVLNNGEAGDGVTLGTAGIEIDRGTVGGLGAVENNHARLVFDESDDTWKLDNGSGVLEPIATGGDANYTAGDGLTLSATQEFAVDTTVARRNADNTFTGDLIGAGAVGTYKVDNFVIDGGAF